MILQGSNIPYTKQHSIKKNENFNKSAVEDHNLGDGGDEADDDDDEFDATVSELIARNRKSNSGQNGASPGINQIPPRPDNPTPPKMLPRRPASGVGCRYIPADAGELLFKAKIQYSASS